MLSCSVVSDSFFTLWTVAPKAPLSMVFPRQEYWNGLPFPMPGELPDPGIELACPRLAGRCFTTESQGKLCQKKKKKSVGWLVREKIYLVW